MSKELHPGWSLSLRLGRLALAGFWAPALLLALWWVLSSDSTSAFYPPLHKIVARLRELWIDGSTAQVLLPSLANLARGYGLAVVLGMAAAVIFWRLPRLLVAARPTLFFLYALPAIATLPALISIFGIGTARQIAFIAYGAFWPTLLNTIDGLRSVDAVKIDTAVAMHLSRSQMQRWVVLPAAMPQIVAGLRSSLQVAIILMIVSEMVGSHEGLGYFILQSQSVFAIMDMWTGILVLAGLGMLINYSFVTIEHRFLRWHYQSKDISRAAK